MEEKETKVVVKTLDAGLAKPIAISSEDALNIARAQNENNHEADITLEEEKIIEQIVEEGKRIAEQEAVQVEATNYNQELNKEKINEVNDIVKIKTVKKNNPKIVIALIIVLAIIILCFFIFELPYLINLLRK